MIAGTAGATTLTIGSAYSLTHNKTTPVYQSVWNQLILEYKTGSGSWTPISPFDIQWDKLETIYKHTAGDDTYSYRFRFYNSTNVDYSEYSPTVVGSGFTNVQVGQMVVNVRRKIRDPNRQRYSDSDIIALLQQGQNDIQIRIPKLWVLKVDTFENGTGIQATANNNIYSLASYPDINYISKIRYQYVNGGTTQIWDLIPEDEMEFDRYTQVIITPRLDDNIARVKLLPPSSTHLNGAFKVYPTIKNNNVGVFYPVYYRKFTPLNDVSDTTDLPFPEILEDYAAYRLHQLMGNKLQAEIYKKTYSGPSFASKDEPLTGIALLQMHNSNVKNVSMGYGKSLVRYGGRRGRSNYLGHGRVNRDYERENYF